MRSHPQGIGHVFQMLDPPDHPIVALLFFLMYCFMWKVSRSMYGQENSPAAVDSAKLSEFHVKQACAHETICPDEAKNVLVISFVVAILKVLNALKGSASEASRVAFGKKLGRLLPSSICSFLDI